ncbi:MAG TPA: DUF72 domain-containing protein [Xanthomonadales bacterium]|nr:DUF72 domain-containing protein [Xanthomonadales bacterium]
MPVRLRDAFGGAGSVLARYAAGLSCVEINSSFYRPHRRETYARWAQEVPAGFRFAVKLPQAITHDLRLRGALRLLDEFLAQACGLGPAMGPLLVQLPASFHYDGRTAGGFFRALRARHPGPVVCEPRHASWFGPRALALMAAARIGLVGADPACCPAAARPVVADRVAYYRWHGSPRKYWSPYGEARLAPLAAEILGHGDAGVTSWCILDNTASQAAAHDALALQSMLRRARVTSAKRTATSPFP